VGGLVCWGLVLCDGVVCGVRGFGVVCMFGLGWCGADVGGVWVVCGGWGGELFFGVFWGDVVCG